MPRFSKEVVSRYIRTECKRQLSFYLYPDTQEYQDERESQNIPPKQPPRPGVNISKEVGQEWEKRVYNDLLEIYNDEQVILKEKDNSKGYGEIELSSLDVNEVSSWNLILQPKYNIPEESSFERGFNISSYREKYDLDYTDLIPDIIQVLPPRKCNEKITPEGQKRFLEEKDYDKLQLRVIDIKNVAEPSSAYFAEVAYYMLTLAGWLKDNGLDEEFVVVEGAVWPGSHDGSTLRKEYEKAKENHIKPKIKILNKWLREDIEFITFSVFSTRLKNFLTKDLQEVLEKKWFDFPINISSKCSFCDYFGHEVRSDADERHCRLQAKESDHLSRIANISEGAIKLLIDHGIEHVKSLAKIDSSNSILDNHHSLKSDKTIIPERAKVLEKGEISVPDDIGHTAIMPKWSDLSICISVDFDISSGITVAFGLKGFWIEPWKKAQSEREKRSWPSSNFDGVNGTEVFMVHRKDKESERRTFMTFLRKIDDILHEAEELDRDTDVQVYIWDEIEMDHLQRLVGRYLPSIIADENIRNDIAWLFPSEESVDNPQHEGSFKTTSPVTIIKNVINNLIALPIPYYYSLLETARSYAENARYFNVDDLFEDKLNDQIPSERAHEIWSRSDHQERRWDKQFRIYQDTVARRIKALDEVREKLRSDLEDLLQSNSPKVRNLDFDRVSRASTYGQIWYAFANLNKKIEENEKFSYHAMPPHKREAKLVSARLEKRLTGEEKSEVLDNKFNLEDKSNRRVYIMKEDSKAVKLKEGDFLCCLSPDEEANRLHENFYYNFINEEAPALELVIRENYDGEIPGRVYGWTLSDVTRTTIKKIDREEGYIVVDIKTHYWKLFNINFVEQLEDEGFDFSNNVSLDPIHKDYFTDKLKDCLRLIGNPDIAKDRAQNIDIIEKLGFSGYRESRDNRDYVAPATDFLWDATNMDTELNIYSLGDEEIDAIKEKLKEDKLNLDRSQWMAWKNALKNRLQVIWGPPGTGKSRTLRSIIVGLLEVATSKEQPIRILISSATYNATDNVLLDVYENHLCDDFNDDLEVKRLRSPFRDKPENLEDKLDLEMDSSNPEVDVLYERLKRMNDFIIVGATPEQIYKFITKDHEENDLRDQQVEDGEVPELFDFLIIDEASQMEVAKSLLPFCSLSREASVILAGDPRQLPPIHQAELPVGIESMVGSIYNYMVDHYDANPIMLKNNYRSNKEIVNFIKRAGYGEKLNSYSPDLELNLITPIQKAKPANWPEELYWTPTWSEIMDPDRPTVCFVYEDGISSQWNDFEVDAIASSINVIYDKLTPKLKNDKLATENNNEVFKKDKFWKKGIGIVTPHNAQKSKIINKLQNLYGDDVSDLSIIRSAVDTVERFQGQERHVMLASFALGDPDMISQEEEFLMNLNRFNVMASRAKAKLVVFVSQEIVDYLASDLEVLKESRLIKIYAEEFSESEELKKLGYYNKDGELEIREGYLRYNEK